jgi:hypothetical protein
LTPGSGGGYACDSWIGELDGVRATLGVDLSGNPLARALPGLLAYPWRHGVGDGVARGEWDAGCAAWIA